MTLPQSPRSKLSPAFFVNSPIGYAVLIGVVLLIFLIVVGLNTRSLPFIPGQTYSDAVVSHWPDTLFFQRSMQSGSFPLWRPLIMSGQPFAANPLNKVWYPFQWLSLLWSATVHLNIMLWLHLLIAAVGMRALLRRLGLSVLIASIGGAVYAFTPRLMALGGAGHIDTIEAMAWFPYLLLAIEQMSPLLLGVSGALCFIGDVRAAYFAFLLTGTYALWRWTARGRHWPELRGYLIGGGLTVLLTAVEWLPLLIMLPLTSRSGMTAQDANVMALSPAQLVTLIISNRSGSQETMLYVGLAVIVLAAIALVLEWRKRWFWGMWVVIALLYGLGSATPFWSALAAIIPPVRWLRVPARAWEVGLFAAIVLASYGLQRITNRTYLTVDRKVLHRASVVVLCVGVAAALLGIAVHASSIAVPMTLLLSVSIGVLLTSNQRARIGWWVGLIALDLLIMDTSLIEGRDQSVWLDSATPLAQTLIQHGAARVYADPAEFQQQVAAYWNIPAFGGIDPFQYSNYVQTMEQATGLTLKGYNVVLVPSQAEDSTSTVQTGPLNADLLATWQVSHVVLDAALVDQFDFKLVDTVQLPKTPKLYVYANQKYAPTRLIRWQGPNQVTIKADDTVIGVVSDSHGWQLTATADGLSTYTYSPTEVYVAAGISGLTAFGCLIALIVRLWHARLKVTPQLGQTHQNRSHMNLTRQPPLRTQRGGVSGRRLEVPLRVRRGIEGEVNTANPFDAFALTSQPPDSSESPTLLTERDSG